MIAEVRLWGRTIGAVSMDEERDYAAFQYTDEFAASGIEVAPLTLPLSSRVYEFPELPRATFHGLPGLLADSLPDRFGNALIDAWLATQGRSPESFSAIERLCYTGTRGMGAFEFAPVLGPKPRKSTTINIDALVTLASDILTERRDFTRTLSAASRRKALADILKVGTSAGGARAKAVIAWNRKTNEVRSGQVAAGPGFGQDDHVKNIAFLMNQEGEWSLAPAFDVTYSYNPSGSWTATHQMTLNGKREQFVMADLRAGAKSAGLKRGRAETILDEVGAAVGRWKEFAGRAKLADDVAERIRKAHRLELAKN